MKKNKKEYEYWYDDKGRVVGKMPVGFTEDYGWDDLEEEL